MCYNVIIFHLHARAAAAINFNEIGRYQRIYFITVINT